MHRTSSGRRPSELLAGGRRKRELLADADAQGLRYLLNPIELASLGFRDPVLPFMDDQGGPLSPGTRPVDPLDPGDKLLDVRQAALHGLSGLPPLVEVGVEAVRDVEEPGQLRIVRLRRQPVYRLEEEPVAAMSLRMSRASGTRSPLCGPAAPLGYSLDHDASGCPSPSPRPGADRPPAAQRGPSTRRPCWCPCSYRRRACGLIPPSFAVAPRSWSLPFGPPARIIGGPRSARGGDGPASGSEGTGSGD